MPWQTPVYDRTAADVAAGADKCYFSADTLNRIEGNIAYLADLFGVEVECKTWVSTDFLTESQMQRILANLQTVREAYYTLPGTPDTPALPATLYTAVNAIEEIEWRLADLWQKNTSSDARYYAGEIYTGQIGVM